jgi:RimJ/RimL family protein N-acetyltransferase
MEPMIELVTPRLLLRTLCEADWPAFHEINLDPEVNLYVRQPESDAAIREKFEQRTQPWFYGAGEWLSLVIEERETGLFVGITGLRCVDFALNRAEVGYLLARNGQGKGFGTESLRAILDWAGPKFQVHKFVALCAKENMGSRRVLEKCGFVLEGIFTDNMKIGDSWIDDCAYGLLACHDASESSMLLPG